MFTTAPGNPEPSSLATGTRNRRDALRPVSPLEEIEQAVHARAKAVVLDLDGADGEHHLRELIDE